MVKEITDLQDVLNDLLPRDAERIILEAGCGSATYINFGSKARLVGIDISKKQLERNPVLSAKIQGDLETYQFPSGSFDVAICWEVLEHLSRPRQALDNMVRCLRPGGYLLSPA